MRQLGPLVALPENRVARQALRRAASAMRRGSVPVSLLPLTLHGPPGVGSPTCWADSSTPCWPAAPT